MLFTMELIIHYVRIFVINMCVYYCFDKMLNIKENQWKNGIVFGLANLIIILVYVPIRMKINLFLLFAVMYFVYSLILAKLTNNNLGCSMVTTIIAYAITIICYGVSVVVQFIPYRIFKEVLSVDNKFLSLAMISTIQFILLYGFFRIKRFRNGFSFLTNKLNNEITDAIVINLSIIVIMIYSLAGVQYNQITWSLTIIFIIIGITMFFTIKKMITMYYKQKLLTDTMEEYKQELISKQNEIDKLKNDKKNVSKITHEFYNRQKALELLVTSNMNSDNIDKENTSKNVLEIIESLTNDYSNRYEAMKELPKLDITEIQEIDNMFKYMQSECDKNNIVFKLKIMGNIHSLVNNIILKNKLETLIGDHVIDAINAVNLCDTENKEIFIILGIKDKKYELSIFDTGVDFEVDTLVKLGLESVTTNAERGGTGTGFMTTFETMKETKASLIITEFPINNERHYSKCVTIRFDGKHQYRICSYRSDEIKKNTTDNRIKIEQYINK